MKKIISLLLFVFLFSFPAESGELPRRALFVSVLQDPPVLSSREAIKKLIEFSNQSGVRTLFVQVYRANQSWFPSKFADPSPYEQCFKNVGEDALAVLIKEAHASGIEVHAWLNLMSLSANENAPMLKKYGPEILTVNSLEKKKLEDYKIDKQYFLEPGDPRVREELLAIVAELVSRYRDLDGVQFDYIRYPDKDPFYGYTKINLQRFKEATGHKVFKEDSRTWKRWKRDQVTGLLKALVKKSRVLHPGIQVSTTGLMSYNRAYFEGMQDWRLWVNSGLLDFVTLMCYTHEDTARFKRYIEDARRRLGDLKRVNIAVGSYALMDSPEVFTEQFELCEESKARSCVVLDYGDFIEKPELSQPFTRKNS